MTAVSKRMRDLVYRRDNNQCVTCGTFAPLTIQHRVAVGMGGSKIARDASELLTACVLCNDKYEASGQSDALYFGWKVRRFCPVQVETVPVFYRVENRWRKLNRDGSADWLTGAVAMRLRALAGLEPSMEAT